MMPLKCSGVPEFSFFLEECFLQSGCIGGVLGSTGLRRSAANDQMGDRGVTEASIDCLVAPEVAFRKKSKKGVLEASGDLFWPTFHSYWHDKHKNLGFIFCCSSLKLPCRGYQAHDSKQKEDQYHTQVAQLSV